MLKLVNVTCFINSELWGGQRSLPERCRKRFDSAIGRVDSSEYQAKSDLYEKWAEWRKDAYDPRVDFSTVGDLLMVHTELAGVPDHDVNELLCQ